MGHQQSTNSQQYFEQLLANLRQEEARIESTLSLLNDLSSLQYDEAAIRMRIETAQSLTSALQNDRQVILNRISQRFGIPGSGMNLSALATLCPPNMVSKLFAAKQSLTRTLYLSQRMAMSTTILVNESLRLQQVVLSSLLGITVSDRYDAQGSQPMDTGITRMESRS